MSQAYARALARLTFYDELLLQKVRALRFPLVTKLMRTFTHLGDATSWTFAGLLLFAVGGEATSYAQRLSTAALLATAVTQVLKRVCVRKRPSSLGFTALADDPDVFSFPSGHTAAAFAVAIALAGAGAGMGVFLLAFACAVALSRVYLGAHYPLDVGVGAVLGCAMGLVARLACGT